MAELSKRGLLTAVICSDPFLKLGKAQVPVASVVSLRKGSVSLPAPNDILDKLAAEADLVVSAMGD